MVFHGDGTITFPSDPSYWGAWSQPTADTLAFTYSDVSGVVATFSGGGTGGDCWEGITHFTSSSYVAPYEVCLQ